MVARLSRDLILGCALVLVLGLGFGLGTSGCAKVAGQMSGAAGSGGGPGGSGGGGMGGDAGDDGGAGSPIFDGSIFGERPPPSVCGNSVVEYNENCDDGNTTDGDGCSSACVIEPHYSCPMVGKPCVHDVVCGDHEIEGNEACDDGNTVSGDGCSADCSMVECGWECPPMAACRAAKCGDGEVAGNEQCDDGNNTDGDGCSADCTLESKPASVPEGWVCTTPTAAASAADGGTDGGADGGAAAACKGPTTCTTSTCGNKIKEGSEQCDDGNTVTGDGCSPFCRLEPACPAGGGACMNPCGSGLLLSGDGKQCDDGNTVDGDGCSSTCMVEPGYMCKPVTVSANPVIIPVVYHDFQSWKDPSGHPDFEHYPGNGQAGIAQPVLGSAGGGVPVHVASCTPWTSNLCDPGTATPTWDPTVDWFGMWYVDTPAYNKTIVQTLTLGGQVNGTASTTCNTPGQPACTSFQFNNEQFFPIDGLGWGNTPTQSHNFGFTSVARYWFQYSAASTLTFLGDDDVWVYINKQLAVDLGGTHQRTVGSITLDATGGNGYACDYVMPGKAVAGSNFEGLAAACDSTAQTGGHAVTLGLTAGKIYEIAVFQAERHTSESHYQLTLSNFSGTRSQCTGACGDGVVTAPEKCDLGAAMNTGAYGGCNTDCTLAPYCGDGTVQSPIEECEPAQPGCTADCKKIVVK